MALIFLLKIETSTMSVKDEKKEAQVWRLVDIILNQKLTKGKRKKKPKLQ